MNQQDRLNALNNIRKKIDDLAKELCELHKQGDALLDGCEHIHADGSRALEYHDSMMDRCTICNRFIAYSNTPRIPKHMMGR